MSYMEIPVSKRKDNRPVKLLGDPLDSRGLPMSYDPRNFYEYHFETLSQGASGLESFLYKFIPYDYIRSFAFAINPMWKFGTSPTRITPPNRNISRMSSAIGDLGIRHKTGLSETRSSAMYNGCPTGLEIKSPGVVTDSIFYANHSTAVTRALFGKDTTARTRPIGSDYGECAFSHVTVFNPDRVVRYSSETKTHLTKPSCTVKKQYTENKAWSQESISPGAYLTLSSAKALCDQELAFAKSILTARGLELVRRAVPTSRYDSLLRNVIELRDIPRSVLQLRDTLGGFREIYRSISDRSIRDAVFGFDAKRHLSGEYLSFQFGWRQLYNDLRKMLTSPERVAKRLNRLVSSAGKKAMYGSTIKFSDALPSSSPTLHLGLSADREYSPFSTQTAGVRNCHLRCSMKATFRFPDANVPKFREEYFARSIGTNLVPGDFYDLIPWSWLVDWFTGAGEYLHAVQEINDDPSLIDYGFISSRVESTLDYHYKYRELVLRSFTIDGIQQNDPVYNYYDRTYQAGATVVSYVRKDASTLMDMKSPSNYQGLSLYKQTILGALFAQRMKT